MIFENQEVKGTLYEDSDFLFWLMVYILQSKKFYFTFFAKSLLKKQTYDIVTRKLYSQLKTFSKKTISYFHIEND